MIATTTRVLLPSCDIILSIAIMKLLRVLPEPALLVTSSLRHVRIIAGSSAMIAGSSITIVSSVSTIVVPVSWSCDPATLQIYTLYQGVATPTVFGMFRAGTRQNLLCSRCTPLISSRIVVLASDPSICISY